MDNQNYFQTSKGHITWIIYKVNGIPTQCGVRAVYCIKSIGIIKSIPVSKTLINDTFNKTFHNDINKHKCYFDPKMNNCLIKLMFCVCLITSF